jgi:hypothetical protein
MSDLSDLLARKWPARAIHRKWSPRCVRQLRQDPGQGRGLVKLWQLPILFVGIAVFGMLGALLAPLYIVVRGAIWGTP